MGLSVTEKILQKHCKEKNQTAGKMLACTVDAACASDLQAPLAALLYEQTKLKKPALKEAMFAVDHAISALDSSVADEQTYIERVAVAHGITYAKAGNGISHLLQAECAGAPGRYMIGTDFYTSACGGVGTFATTVTAMELVAALVGSHHMVAVPKVAGIVLKGKMRPGVSGKDVGLEVLRRLTVKGGRGKVLEYAGPGVAQLSIDERMAIAAMGAETGAKASIFPADSITKKALVSWGRGGAFRRLEADRNATYDEAWDIDLSKIEPLVANPGSPDNVMPAKLLKNITVEQVCIGFSLHDLRVAAALLHGKKIAAGISLLIVPGTRAILLAALQEGIIGTLLKAEARILEPGYGPAEGLGFSPRHGGGSMRTFYRNIVGTTIGKEQQIYLGSPETAVATALRGEITPGNSLGKRVPAKPLPKWQKNGLLFAEKSRGHVDIVRGPGIVPIPLPGKLPHELQARIMLRMGDNVSTAHIIAPSAKTYASRTNFPALAQLAFKTIDADFPDRCRDQKLGILVAGDHYGAGLAREYTAILCAYLGLRVVMALSFSNLHRKLLLYAGCLPLLLKDRQSYLRIAQGDELALPGTDDILKTAAGTPFQVKNISTGNDLSAMHDLTAAEIAIIKAGGLLPYAMSAKSKK